MYRKVFIFVLVLLVVVGIYHVYKPLPTNINYQSEVYNVSDSSLYFFSDVTYLEDEVRQSDQEIFDEIFRMIDEADHYVLIDMFFFSNFIGVETAPYRSLSQELTDKLIAKKQSSPSITIQVITDPINVMYGGHISDDFERLRAVGIPVIVTELKSLRDSNPIYSSLWRVAFQWFSNNDQEGWLPNPLDAKSPDLSIRTYLKMLNYKANHRKVVMSDYGLDDKSGFSVLVTSANPHDGSSAHSNIAVRVDEMIWSDVLVTEAAVAKMSGYDLKLPDESLQEEAYVSGGEDLFIQFLTENKIKEKVLAVLNSLEAGDALDIAMFYFSDRDIVDALKVLDSRGVQVRILLDPNKDAFGREKNGMPNRQVAHELMSDTSGNLSIRWCNTHGEQCHSKLLLATKDETKILIQGSANYTKRNLDNLNLETNIALTGDASAQVMVDAGDFFNKRWSNIDKQFSVPYEEYADSSLAKTLSYRLKELTGLSRW